MRLPALILFACAPASVQAHTFGQPYTLPVPLWLYAWGAAAALAVSFLAAGWFMAAPASVPAPPVARRALPRIPGLGPALRLLSVVFLLLTVTTGLFGNRDPLHNFSMTAFWIWFVLGVTYATALCGNFFAVLNPWRLLAEALGRAWPAYRRGRFAWPAAWGNWPALALYMAFVAWELLGWHRPQSLGAVLGAYTLLTLLAAGLVGVEAWFRHGELFAVLLRYVGLLAPLQVERGGDGRARLAAGAPGHGVLAERPAQFAAVLFVLFMLSSTAFDGLHATRFWFTLFWRDPTGIASALVGHPPLDAIAAAQPWFLAWQGLALVLSPFLYLAPYLAALAAARALAGGRRPLRELALDFAFTLLPIALAYHFTHYFTLLLSQGMKLFSLVSDPFGWGWNLFGTRELFRAPYIPELTLVWHTQVGLIVLGHVASVLLAHRVALQVFRSRRAALLSQVPMLMLMVGFTVAGLWILAQPLQSTLIRG